MHIRDLTKDDYPKLVPFVQDQWNDSPFFEAKINIDKLTDVLDQYISMEDTFGRIVLRDDGETIMAMYLGGFTEYTISDRVGVHIDHFYAINAFAAVRIFKDFEKWAKSKGAKDMHSSIHSGKKVDNSIRLHQIMGYDISGYSFKKEISYG